MLVTFEGQDGAGKTTLSRLVSAKLQERGFTAIYVPEFSTGPIGLRLAGLLLEDKFLRPTPRGGGILARTLEIAADLYYLDETLIAPLHKNGAIVLKDRHCDSILACQGPALEHDLGWSRAQAEVWLRAVLGALAVVPDFTFFVTCDPHARLRRIRTRVVDPISEESDGTSLDDMAVFAQRDQWYEFLVNAQPGRFLVVANDGAPASDVAEVLVDWVVNRVTKRGSGAQDELYDDSP